MANLDDLPQTEFEGEVHVSAPQPISICPTHTRDNWRSHNGYISNRDGTISCIYCPWGSRIAGYFKVLEGRIVDLRTL